MSLTTSLSPSVSSVGCFSRRCHAAFSTTGWLAVAFSFDALQTLALGTVVGSPRAEPRFSARQIGTKPWRIGCNLDAAAVSAHNSRSMVASIV